MKQKEALKGIKQAIAEHLHLKTGVSVEKHFEYLQYDTEIDIVDKALSELEELKRYPTSEEVCEELSRCYCQKITYVNDEYNNGFYNQYKYMIMSLSDKGLIHFTQDTTWRTNNLPPHIMTLIGRFYEGVEKVGKKDV